MSGAQEYVKVASSHLTRAASELSRQAHELRANHENNKRQLEREVIQLEGKIRSTELEAVARRDDGQQGNRARDIADMRREINVKKEQVHTEEVNKQRELRTKQSMSMQLDEEARGLNTLAGNPDLR